MRWGEASLVVAWERKERNNRGVERPPRAARLVALLSILLVAACSDAEPIGVHLTLAADGSGTVTCRSLVMVDEAGPMEAGSAGVEWRDRARLTASRGEFRKLDGLVLADLGWRRTGENSLRVNLPMGPEARWHTLLAPEPTLRPRAAAALEPAQPTSAMGDSIRFELELPGEVTAIGHAPNIRLVRSDKDGRKAILTVPVAAARAPGPALMFDVAWR